MGAKAGLCTAFVAGAAGVGLGVAGRQVKQRFGCPPRRAPGTGSVPTDAVDVAIRSADGATIRGWWRRPPAARHGGARWSGAAALVVHGWGGSATDMLPVSEPLLGAGLSVLVLDTRCHGRSDDAALTSMPAFAEDIRSALAWLRGQPEVDQARVVLVGHSVGAGACLFVAAGDRGVAAVVSLASMADPETFMSRRLRRVLPSWLASLALRYVEHTIGHRFAEFSPVHTIGRVRAPVLLLHGDRDATVPVTDAFRLHAEAPGHSRLVVLPDADHNDLEALDGATPALLDFLRDNGLVGPTG